MQQRLNPSKSMVRQLTKQYLMISIVPVVMFFLFAMAGGYFAQRRVSDFLDTSTRDLTGHAKRELEALGQRTIQAHARSAAREVALFLTFSPDLDLKALQQSEAFKAIAMQRVGETGYVAVYEAQTGIMRLHPNPSLVDRKMDFLAQEIPSFWSIWERSLAGHEISGYYDWIEPDGSLRKKYMTMTPVEVPIQGKTLMVAATTYIDEFSTPVVAMERQAASIGRRFDQFFSNQILIAGCIMFLFLVIMFACAYLIGRRSALYYMQPIVTMTASAETLGNGHWETAIQPALTVRKDEVGVLARSFESMRGQLQKLFRDLEQRVAELKQTQASLRESEAHFKGLFDGVPVGLYRTTFDGRSIDANPTLVHMLGYPSKEAFLSQKVEAIYVDPADRANWLQLIEHSGDSHVVEIKLRRADQSVIWVENHARTIRNQKGEILYIEGSLTDITERKDAASALYESEKRYRSLYEEAEQSKELYRSLLNSSADAIMISDTSQKTTYVNPAFSDLFGWTLAQIEGRSIPFVPDTETDQSHRVIRDVVEKGATHHGYETKRFTHDGQTIDVSISVSHYEDFDGRPSGILQILRDISGRKKMEAQLQMAQRMEAIGTLAGGLAHDFNNLMMGILGNISIMMLDSSPTDPQYEKLERIEKLVQSGSKLTSQLLGYARKGKFEIKAVDLSQVIRDSTEIFGRTRKEVAVHLDLCLSRITVEVDRSQIEQVLLNLFINAADAMPDGGKIRLATSILSDSQIGGKPYKPSAGTYAMLQISDTGHGMTPETQTRIFDPFFTTKEMGRGTGLGLASTYGIVKAHAGYIDVTSQIDQGTTFTIYLPVSNRNPTQMIEADTTIKFGQGTILVVDDEQIILDVGTEMITKMGYTPITARSGDEAIALFKQKPAAIDLVILDLIMPGTSGSETFDRLRAIDPAVKVLLASGYSLDSQANRLISRGCNGFIQKPYNLEALSLKIDEALNSRP